MSEYVGFILIGRGLILCRSAIIWLFSWRYTRTLIMDGNFKAEHMHEKCPGDQVWLMDGLGYMVTRPEYQTYLKDTAHPLEVCSIYKRFIDQSL